jgi:hypothetical protein
VQVRDRGEVIEHVRVHLCEELLQDSSSRFC